MTASAGILPSEVVPGVKPDLVAFPAASRMIARQPLADQRPAGHKPSKQDVPAVKTRGPASPHLREERRMSESEQMAAHVVRAE